MILKLKYIFISRALIILSGLLAINLIPQRTGYLGLNLNGQLPYLLWIWSNFDGQHYLQIASEGYNGYNFAFFPLYPFLIGLMSRILSIPVFYLGLLTSTISFFLAVLLIYKITLLDYKPRVASLTLLLISFFPLSFYYNSIYADSLFLLLSTSSFYFARKKRWWICGIFGGLSALTRFSGLALIPALCFEWYIQNKPLKLTFRSWAEASKQVIPALLLTFTGFITYLSYLQIKFGDFMLFQKSMAAWKQSELTFPLQVFYRYLKIFYFVNPHLLEYWIAVLEFISFIFFMLLSYYVTRKIRLSYGVFMFVLLILVTFTGTFNGTPRYALHLFPSFISIAYIAYKHPYLKWVLIPIFISLGTLLTMLFTRGYFVA